MITHFKRHNRTLTAAIAATLLLGIGSAYAAGAFNGKAAVLLNSPTQPTQAIDAALAKMPGQAVEIEFKQRAGQAQYQVHIIANGQKHKVRVQAADATVASVRPDHDDDDDDRYPTQMPPVSLKQAVHAAQAKTGGRAKEAELKSGYGASYYRVETVTNGKEYDVRVNAQNGKVESVYEDQDD